jgi:long-chain acyl-CoA synthetase
MEHLRLLIEKKNIFKLAQGEYVAVEYLETIYIRSPYVSQIFIFGDSLQNYLVAIAVPDPDSLIPAAAQQGIKEDIKELCRNPQIKKFVYTSLIKVAEKAKLKGFEKIKNIHLEPEQWTPENGLLTPTLKAKRPELRKHYAKIIETLYAEPRLDGHVPKSKL